MNIYIYMRRIGEYIYIYIYKERERERERERREREIVPGMNQYNHNILVVRLRIHTLSLVHG